MEGLIQDDLINTSEEEASKSNRNYIFSRPEDSDKVEMKPRRFLGETSILSFDKMLLNPNSISIIKKEIVQRRELLFAASFLNPVGLISHFAMRIGIILQRTINEVDKMSTSQIPRCLIADATFTNQLHTSLSY